MDIEKGLKVKEVSLDVVITRTNGEVIDMGTVAIKKYTLLARVINYLKGIIYGNRTNK
jgi:hypothetical protein